MGSAMGKSGGNFLDALPTQGTMHVVMLGLDSAGKTTALYRLKFDQYLNTVPTIGFNCEKVQGTVGKAKGVQFLVWDVGGQEKLRPLWRSYTRCTDGILFVVDSVDVERMEEAKMELMRTAKCPDNQGVPVLILANKQDLPGAREPKELEKLLGLHELLFPMAINLSMGSTSSSTGNIVGCTSSSSSYSNSHTGSAYGRSLTPTTHHNKSSSYGYDSAPQGGGARGTGDLGGGNKCLTKDLSIQFPLISSSSTSYSSTSLGTESSDPCDKNDTLPISVATTPTSAAGAPPTTQHHPATCTTSHHYKKQTLTNNSGGVITNNHYHQYKGWYIQPACAITGEGLQEGLEALYEMILKRRKLNKAYKKKR